MYPDVGVAASLQNQWGEEIGFNITCLGDRKPLTGEEDLIILAAPDPTGQAACIALNGMVTPDTPLVLFNPRLASGVPPAFLCLAEISIKSPRNLFTFIQEISFLDQSVQGHFIKI